MANKSKRLYLNTTTLDSVTVIGLWYNSSVYKLISELKTHFDVHWALDHTPRFFQNEWQFASYSYYTAYDTVLQIEYGLISNSANYEAPELGEGLFLDLAVEKRPYLFAELREWTHFLLLKGLPNESDAITIAFDLQHRADIQSAQWIKTLSEQDKEFFQF